MDWPRFCLGLFAVWSGQMSLPCCRQSRRRCCLNNGSCHPGDSQYYYINLACRNYWLSLARGLSAQLFHCLVLALRVFPIALMLNDFRPTNQVACLINDRWLRNEKPRDESRIQTWRPQSSALIKISKWRNIQVQFILSRVLKTPCPLKASSAMAFMGTSQSSPSHFFQKKSLLAKTVAATLFDDRGPFKRKFP